MIRIIIPAALTMAIAITMGMRRGRHGRMRRVRRGWGASGYTLYGISDVCVACGIRMIILNECCG